MAATLMPNKSDATSSSPPAPAGLSRRETQVMDILHRRTGATVAEIMADLPDPPTYSAVRSVLRILGEKQLIKHREDGPRYIYLSLIHISGPTRLGMISYAVFCLKKKK